VGELLALEVVQKAHRAQPVLGVLVQGGGEVDGDLAGADDEGALAEGPRRRTALMAP